MSKDDDWEILDAPSTPPPCLDLLHAFFDDLSRYFF